MTTRKRISFLYLIFLFLLMCCHKDDKALSFAPVTKAAGPDSVSVNQEASFVISYYLVNGCGSFDHIEAVSKADTTTVSVIGRYEGSVCTDALVPGEATYIFKSVKPGTYYLKFRESADSYLLDTIIVKP